MKRNLSLLAAGLGIWCGLRRALARGFFARKVVFITGGSRGLGLVLARQLVRRGARLAICARDGAELERARAELSKGRAEVLAIVADVSDPVQASIAVEQTLRRYGRLDVVSNHAGIIQVAPLSSMGPQDFREAMEVNYFGPVHVSLAALPYLRKRRGRIVNITSIGAAVPVPHLLPYTASKFAFAGFSQGLAAELAREGICVTTVLPGLMRTGSFVKALFKGQREKEVAWFAVGASLPGVSLAAERAARRILLACALGEGYVTVGLPAKALRLFHALAPGLALRVLQLVNLLLPGPGGAGPEEEAEPGWLHRSGASKGILTRLGDRAARRNREVPWAPPAK